MDLQDDIRQSWVVRLQELLVARNSCLDLRAHLISKHKHILCSRITEKPIPQPKGFQLHHTCRNRINRVPRRSKSSQCEATLCAHNLLSQLQMGFLITEIRPLEF